MSRSSYQPDYYDEIRQISDPYERLIKVGDYVIAKYIAKDYEVLTTVERDILHMSLLVGEVNNGGFDQYFFNTGGDYAVETVETLERIGSSEALALLRQAIGAFGANPLSTDKATRYSQIKNIPKTVVDLWNELDQQFFRLQEPLWQLVLNYFEEQWQ